MSNLIQEIVFPESGLNWDDDQRVMRPGDSVYRLNILIGEDESSGVITNALGNHVVTYPLGSANTYFVVGSCYDSLNRCVYYWIFSQPYDVTSSGDYEYDNRLLRFNEDSETIELIFLDTHNYFGLSPVHLMRDPFIIGDALYFNPMVSEPKVIDVVRAYNYTNYDIYDAFNTYTYGQKCTYYGGLFMANQAVAMGETPVTHQTKWDRIGDSYSDYGEFQLNFDSEFRYAFNVLREPPVYRPEWAYDYDATKPTNNIKGLVFRFSYRYKYYDNTYSVFSSYSDVTLPDIEEYYNGEVVNATSANNFIKINLALPSPALVKEVEVVFKEIDSADWKRAKIINRQDIEIIDESIFVYRFFNDESYISIANAVVAKVYDAVPRTAECQEIINKNILCYGYCKEGFNNIDKNNIDVSLIPEIDTFTTPDEIGDVRRNNVNEGDTILRIYKEEGVPVGWNSILQFGAWWSTVLAGDIYRVQIGTENYLYTIQAADVLSEDALVAAITVFLTTSYPEFTVTADFVNDTITIYHYDIAPLFRVSIFYFIGAGTDTSLYKKRGFKTGSWHPFCLFYYDGAMRRWDAQTSKDNLDGTDPLEILGTTVYVPMFMEMSPPSDVASRWIINWEIRHQPPEGAKYWRWGYASNSLCSWFVQYIISEIQDENDNPPDSVRIDITPLQELTIDTTTSGLNNQFPNSVISPYNWEQGDRVRFITQASDSGDIGATVDGVYDYEIIKFDKDDNYIYVQRFGHNAAGIGEDTLIEIYRPLKGNTETKFFEYGPMFRVVEDINGDLVHTGMTQDQVWDTSTPAMGVFNAGDVYHILRTPSKAISTTDGYFHESMWYSDFYNSDSWDKGKQGEETTFNERYLNIIRYSNQYLQNTLINGLSTFDGLDYVELNDIYGKILRIIEIGDTLKVYQRKKPSSILIGRTEYVDAEGNANIVMTSERILGAIRYSNTNYGTEFPESISKNNRYVYGFDVYNGVFWRDSANGIFPISGRYIQAETTGDYKMDSYFKQKAKALLVSGIDHIDVMTVWDERYKNLYVIFKDYVDELNNETIIFHEPSNRWICFTEFDQTPVGGWNQILELDYAIVKGFEGGIGYYFDEDTRFAVFDIETPGNFDVSMTLAPLTITAYDPTVTVDCSPSGDVAALTITAYDPTTDVTLAPNPVITYIESIPDGITGMPLFVFAHYSNDGDAILKDISWEVRDSFGTLADSGIESVYFSGQVADVRILLSNVFYPTPTVNWYVISVDGTYSDDFNSTLP